MSAGGGTSGEQRLAQFATIIANKSKGNKTLSVRSTELSEKLKDPVKFNAGGGKPAYGYEATLLSHIGFHGFLLVKVLKLLSVSFASSCYLYKC